jgi:hypothetical protein
LLIRSRQGVFLTFTRRRTLTVRRFPLSSMATRTQPTKYFFSLYLMLLSYGASVSANCTSLPLQLCRGRPASAAVLFFLTPLDSPSASLHGPLSQGILHCLCRTHISKTCTCACTCPITCTSYSVPVCSSFPQSSPAIDISAPFLPASLFCYSAPITACAEGCLIWTLSALYYWSAELNAWKIGLFKSEIISACFTKGAHSFFFSCSLL